MDYATQREAMVAALRERQEISERVAAALFAVPRHLFVPGVDPEDAYRDEPIVTKRDDEGRPISSSSQPAIMASMLDQLGVEPGHRVLEIGAGTGYNAALLARLAGPGGHVVSVDLDDDIVAQARSHLSAAGVPGPGQAGVEVVCADGADGFPGRAPYDRLIATVGVWDLAPAWLAQLGPGGRLVMPLDLRGVQASVAMERATERDMERDADRATERDMERDADRGMARDTAQDRAQDTARAGGRWVSRSVVPCGFMRMRGPFAGPEVSVVLREDPGLMLSLPGPREIGDVLAALDGTLVQVAIEGEDLLSSMMASTTMGTATGMAISLWLTLREPRWCTLSGKLGRGYGMTVGLVEGDGIALLMADGPLVARGYGPGGADLASDLAAHITAWDHAGRPDTSTLQIEAYPRPAPGGEPGQGLGPGGKAYPRPAPGGEPGQGPASGGEPAEGPGLSGAAGPGFVAGGSIVIEKRHTDLVVRFPG